MLFFVDRCWDIKTGKPKKIFHGHQDSILCLDMYEDVLVSGAKDNEVKGKNTKCLDRLFNLYFGLGLRSIGVVALFYVQTLQYSDFSKVFKKQNDA